MEIMGVSDGPLRVGRAQSSRLHCLEGSRESGRFDKPDVH